MPQSAFVLRIAPSGVDLVPEALTANFITIGWSRAEGLLDQSLAWEQFRGVVHEQYHNDEENFRRSGAAAGNLWRFIRGMDEGDYVVVPYWDGFYVGLITGKPTYDTTLISQDSAYRRGVKWLNGSQIISRRFARAALQSRMKIQQTSADASDLVDEITECLKISESGQDASFTKDFQDKLIDAALIQLRSGRIENFGFEKLLQRVFSALGAKEVKIVPRRHDKGADLLATFLVAGAIQQVVAIQAKHWQATPPVNREVVQQLISGIEAEEAHLGLIATSGTISSEAIDEARQYYEKTKIKIELMDGEQLARLMVENGIVNFD